MIPRGPRGRATVAAALLAGLTACTNESPSLQIVTVLPPPSTTISFSADVQPIFSRSCAKSGCHVTSTAAFGLVLEQGQAYGNLVNVPSAEVPSLLRVDPGDSALSYIVNKLEGNAPGSRMPADGPPFLPDAEIQIIKDWIDQGALDN